MLLSNFKADTNLFSSYQMMVRSFKAWEAHTGHAAQGLDWHHRLRSLLSVPLWHLPWSAFFSRFVSSSWHYGISNIHGGRSWSLSAVVNPFHRQAPENALPCVRAVTHCSFPFILGSLWDRKGEGWREKWAGLQCWKWHRMVQIHQNIFVWKTGHIPQHWAQIWSTGTG